MNLPTEFDVFFEYEFEGFLKIRVKIPRERAPLVCSAFDIVMLERRGASFYYPRFHGNKTRCRYEWFLNYQKDPYGIRISTYFDVGDEDIEELPFMLSWGPRFASSIGTPFNKQTQKRVTKEIKSVLMDINRIIHEKTPKIWTFLSHVKLPPGTGIEQTITSEFITVYNSVQHKKEGNLLTAISINLPAHFGAQVKRAGTPIFDKFITLLSLLIGASIKKARTKWPKKFKFKEVFEGKGVPIGKIYPMICYKIAPRQHFDLTDITKIAIDLMAQQSFINDQVLWRSINAYVSGQEIKQSQPTLSSTAFIASLAAYSSKRQCDGEVTCSKCGNLKDFHHDLVSERYSLIEIIKNVLQIETDSDKARDLHNLIGDVYYEQRSAFLHDAVLRHAELDKDVQLGHPEKNKIVSKELKFKEDLDSIQRIARRVLLFRLLPFNSRIRTILNSSSDFRVKHQVQFIFATTVRGRRPVGIKLRHDEEENS